MLYYTVRIVLYYTVLYYAILYYTVLYYTVGIGNTAESDYVKSLCKQATGLGYRVAVLNHTGCLDSQQLTGNRIFTYGQWNII